MNLEICKKCLNCDHVEISYNYNRMEGGEVFYYFRIIGFPTDKICQLRHVKAYKNRREVIDMISQKRAEHEILMEETCPYYVEQIVGIMNQ